VPHLHGAPALSHTGRVRYEQLRPHAGCTRGALKRALVSRPPLPLPPSPQLLSDGRLRSAQLGVTVTTGTVQGFCVDAVANASTTSIDVVTYSSYSGGQSSTVDGAARWVRSTRHVRRGSQQPVYDRAVGMHA